MNDRVFRALMIGSINAVAIATLVYILFPTYADRPLVIASGWNSRLLNLIYSRDNVFNAFPSGHVLYTTVIALFGITWRPKRARAEPNAVDAIINQLASIARIGMFPQVTVSAMIQILNSA